ncbi:MAG: YafY family transcriptional regulator [Gammaproteobacteria bacterium]|nr:YafY family transcriptional regulator [Gammaproteobacteria bacterium]
MRKSDRLFQLTNLLRRYQPVTAQQLAEKLNVSVRSVYRYVDDLSVNGIPVYGEVGTGYRLQDNFELPALNLTPDELDALLVGVRMVSGWTGTELPASARSLLHKICSGLNETMKHHTEANIYVPKLGARLKESEYWEQLRMAIRDQHKIRVEYVTLKGLLSSRQLYPLGLFYWGGKWTLGAWCTLRAAYRDFRVDRIQVLQILEDTFETTNDISLSLYIKTQAQNDECS